MRALAALGLALALGAAACYSPDPASGTLRCGASESCPDGYRCLDADQTCWKNGEAPSTAKSVLDATPFTGHWLFTMAATETTTCSDGSNQSRTLEADYIDVASGTSTDITGDYYCTWPLDIASNGHTATLVPGTTCMTTSPDAKTGQTGSQFTWTGQSFTFTSTGSGTAVLNARISATFVDITVNGVACTTDCTGSCTVEITGPLTLANAK